MVVAAVASGSGTDMASDSGHESLGAWGRAFTRRVWYSSGSVREVEREMKIAVRERRKETSVIFLCSILER